MITFDGVTKAFGKRLALDDVSFTVRRGEVVALLGHNGAGKSTLFALMLGLLRLTRGDIAIDGVSVRHQPRQARRRVGSVLAPAFYEYLSGWDNLRLLASYSGTVSPTEVAETARFVGLAERIHDRVRQYSHGMRRRLALAQALLPRPELLLLDEWESGLDPEGRHEMRDLIVRLNRDHGVTVVLSSHHPSGLHGMCDRLAVLCQGRIVFVGTWTDLRDETPVVMLDLDDWERARPVLEALGASRSAGDRVVLAPGSDVADVVAALVRAEVRVRGVRVADAGSEALYLRALAQGAVELRDAAAVGMARR